MSTAIRKGLLEWARKIGRWLIERLGRTIADRLAAYMLEKVEDFKRRRARARTLRRKRWLDGRIMRWTAAARWLIANQRGLAECARSSFDALAKGDARGIPMDCERLVA